MSTENKLKRVRAPNWEIVEKKLLREVLADYVDTIENKCTDTNTNKRKLCAWQKVFERFNELNVRQRTLVELKQQWRMSKVDAKKIISEHRISKNRTGGGSRPPSPDEDTINLMKLLPLEFEVDHNRFDSDASQIEKHGIVIPNDLDTVLDTNRTSQEDQDITPNNADTNHDSNLIETPKPQIKRNRKLLKQPHSAIQKLSEASQIVESTKLRNTAVFQCLQEEHETKLRQMTETHELQMKQRAEAHEWARQEHLIRLKLLEQQLK